jgi:phosphoribosylamine--glycine ligase
MNEIGCKYKGILYAGLMIKNNEPKLIEYNIRFGDPECQALMLRLDDDLFDIILSCVEEKLDNKPIKWSPSPSITIVAASRGYPESYKTKKELKNLPKNSVKNEQMFHAGTVKIDEKILSNGGRVLNSTVSLPTFKASRSRAIELLNQVKWEDKYFRKDIGWRVIE